MTYDKDRLSQLDATKLMDVVKNYRQYGLDENTRNLAIAVLEERGMTAEELQMGGNYENKTYSYAEEQYKAYHKNSSVALLLNLIAITHGTLIPYIYTTPTAFSLVLQLLPLIGFFIFLLLSAINQNNFNNAIGKESGMQSAVIYLFAGIVLYVLSYFYFRKQMKEAMSMIQ